MHRDIVIVLGRTGQGKSLWSRIFALAHSRLFVYCPLQGYDHIEWTTGEKIIDEYEQQFFGPSNTFRRGISNLADVEVLGAVSYLVGNSLLVLEEFSTIHSRGNVLPTWLSNQIFMGRHRRVSMLVVAQRSASIPIEFRSQATRLITFAQHEPDDLGWLRTFFTKEEIEGIPQLEKGWCLDSNQQSTSHYSIESAVRTRLGFNPHF